MDAISPNTELSTSHTAAPPNSANIGSRQEASISDGVAESNDGVGEGAVIQMSSIGARLDKLAGTGEWSLRSPSPRPSPPGRGGALARKSPLQSPPLVHSLYGVPKRQGRRN